MQVSSREDFDRWRKEFREVLLGLLRIDPPLETVPPVRFGGREELPDHYRERLEIETMEGL